MQRVKIVLKLFLLLLVIYFLLRVVFCMIYFGLEHFSLTVFYWGLRMDITALFYIHIPFFIYYFLMDPFLPLLWQKRLTVFLFSLINIPFIALNYIDLVYFHYTLRRSSIDIFYSFSQSVHSFGSLFRQYWYVLLIFIVVAIVLVLIVRKIVAAQKMASEKWAVKWLVPIIFIALVFCIARGWSARPIVPAATLLYADPVMQPVINNSTLNLLYSCWRSSSRLERKNYFTERALDSIYTIRRQYPQQSGFEKRNVVIFILESFSADFFKGGNDRAKMPFFDSLMGQSTVCVNAFANGHESVMGLTAILGSIPPFTEEPLFLSNYNAVPFNGIGTLLKEEGYSTNFFLGAEYDHFNFAKLCKMTGLEHYYSKDTYGHPEHDDGNWGIYDEFFFPYFGEKMGKQQQPFLSVLFNISSHPPFAIPPAQQNNFKVPGQRDQLNSITYVDYCFSQLFNKIKGQPWFSNTLFVFCADHTLLENIDRHSYQYTAYHIPLFIYDPQHSVGDTISQTVQQLDIVPSLLDKMHYAKPFMSFGNSFFRSDSVAMGFSIARQNGGYQLIDSAMLTGFDDHSNKVLYQYNYKADSALTKNLPVYDTRRENMIKAILQRYTNSLIDQKLLIR